MKYLLLPILPILDFVLVFFTLPISVLFWTLRRCGLHRLPLCKKILLTIGVFPIRKHYYEPQFDYREHNFGYRNTNPLSQLNLNIEFQLSLIKRFEYSCELESFPYQKKNGPPKFYFNNGLFSSGDAEYWYQLIRTLKPKTIIEIGSGYSTIIAHEALSKNIESDPIYACNHICVEPFEQPWLESLPVHVLRSKVENLDVSLFSQLGNNDILFIDSSHIIRPNGDVLYEHLYVLPTLKNGVIVHFHDIFTPNDYPESWIKDEVRFWNEQYLLELLLLNSNSWAVLGALNFLKRNHFSELKSIAPTLKQSSEPASFYIQKLS